MRYYGEIKRVNIGRESVELEIMFVPSEMECGLRFSDLIPLCEAMSRTPTVASCPSS